MSALGPRLKPLSHSAFKRLNRVASLSAVAVLAMLLGLLAQSGIWLDVPFVKQEKYLCGAACISMVMQYWAKSDQVSESSELARPKNVPDINEIGQAVYSKAAKGIFGKDMQRYFHEHGFQTFTFKGEWVDFVNHLSKGRPLIVCLKLNEESSPFHYVVVTGLDQQQSLILINDPAQRKLLKVGRAGFEKAWNLTSNWTLLAIPQDPSGSVVTSSHVR
jgi:ABC-type bacteriocin/lantibiotic exporter with double-glycine peptidase domain